MNLSRALAAAVLVAGCGGRVPGFDHCQPPAGGVTLQQAIAQYPNVTDFCMVDMSKQQLITNPKAVPYDLNTPLFSDYALKTRAAWLPPNTQAQYSPDQFFDFPVGTILVKTFAFAPDLRQPTVGVKLVETRLLIRNAVEWIGLPYIWNDAQTEAALAIGGEIVPIPFIDPSGMAENAEYLVPQANQCQQCHDVGMDQFPIGPKARQLNKDFAYDAGADNQLAHWSALGLLAGAPPPDQAPKLPVWNDPSTGTVDERARAWLEGNCAHCHSEMGLARTTGLTLWASEATPLNYGVCKPPVAAGPATGGRQWDIVPGQPDASILVYRIESTTPGIAMPELGRSIVHAEGVALIREWITAMTGATCQ
jgi:uncharacterized repeat protein (TIGR03806 family)